MSLQKKFDYSGVKIVTPRKNETSAWRTENLVTGTKPVLDVLLGIVRNNSKHFSAAIYSERWGYEICWTYNYIIKQ